MTGKLGMLQKDYSVPYSELDDKEARMRRQIIRAAYLARFKRDPKRMKVSFINELSVDYNATKEEVSAIINKHGKRQV